MLERMKQKVKGNYTKIAACCLCVCGMGAAAAAICTAVMDGEKEAVPNGQPNGVFEVSRESVPGCDDPKHGTTYITYSDGSTAVFEY